MPNHARMLGHVRVFHADLQASSCCALQEGRPCFLEVQASNTAAIGLYTSMGFQVRAGVRQIKQMHPQAGCCPAASSKQLGPVTVCRCAHLGKTLWRLFAVSRDCWIGVIVAAGKEMSATQRASVCGYVCAALVGQVYNLQF